LKKKVFILLDLQRANNAVKYLHELPHDGTVEVEFRDYVKHRSVKQNRALWAVAYPPIMSAIGLSGEEDRVELHEYYCGEFFGWKEYSIMGMKKVRPIRTTTTDEDGRGSIVSKEIMAEFYNFVQRQAAGHGIYVPDPDPMYSK